MKIKVHVEVKEAKEGKYNVRHVHIHFPQDYFINRGDTLVFSAYNREEITIIERPDDYCMNCDNTRSVMEKSIGFNGLKSRNCPVCRPPKQLSK